MRILRIVVRVGLSLVLLAIGGVAVHAAWQGHRARLLQAQIERQVSGRLAEAVPAERGDRNRLADGARAEPDREELGQNCEFSTVDAGWTVESNLQICELRGVFTWSTPDRSRADALAARIVAASGQAFEPVTTDPPGCTLQRSGQLVVIVTDRDCGYPSRLGLRPVGPARGHRVTGLRVEVWTTTSLGVYDLGCRPVTLACDNPLDHAAYGSVPLD